MAKVYCYKCLKAADESNTGLPCKTEYITGICKGAYIREDSLLKKVRQLNTKKKKINWVVVIVRLCAVVGFALFTSLGYNIFLVTFIASTLWFAVGDLTGD